MKAFILTAMLVLTAVSATAVAVKADPCPGCVDPFHGHFQRR